MDIRLIVLVGGSVLRAATISYIVLNLRNEVEIIGEIKHASPMDTYSTLFDCAPVLSAEEFEMP